MYLVIRSAGDPLVILPAIRAAADYRKFDDTLRMVLDQQTEVTSEARPGMPARTMKARFQVLFPRLCRGGTADLVLTNPDSLLDTGIDILVQLVEAVLQRIEACGQRRGSGEQDLRRVMFTDRFDLQHKEISTSGGSTERIVPMATWAVGKPTSWRVIDLTW